MKEPWEIEAESIATNNNVAPELARTFVLLRWMYFGDLRPLADAIMKEQSFDDAALISLALMIRDSEDLPFRIETKRRSGRRGRPKDPSKFIRYFQMSEGYNKLIAKYGRGNSERVLDEVANSQSVIVSSSTVRKARQYRKR